MRSVDREVIPRHCVTEGVVMLVVMVSYALLSAISSREVVGVPAAQFFSCLENPQSLCTPLPIPQSVDSLKRIAWCRSIQNLVAPSRRSTSVANVFYGGVECPNAPVVEGSESCRSCQRNSKVPSGIDLKRKMEGWIGRFRSRDEASKIGVLAVEDFSSKTRLMSWR